MALKKRPLQINGYALPIRFTNRHSAEEFVERVFPTDHALDVRSTIATGYNILRSTHDEYRGYICDLGDRFEVNFGRGCSTPTEWENQSLNVWFD